MKRAYVVNSMVEWVTHKEFPKEIFEAEVTKDLHECPIEVEKGWHYDGSTWSEPTAGELAAGVAALEDSEMSRAIVKIVIALVDKCAASPGVDFVLDDIPAEIRQQVQRAVQRRRS